MSADAARPSASPGDDPSRLRRELARLQAELDQFAHVASRELEAPLRSAGSAAVTLIAARHGRLEGADAEVTLGELASSLDRMHAIVQGLLTYYRTGRGGLKVAPTEAEAACDRAAARLQGEVLGTGAAVTRGRLPQVWADPEGLEEVFFQLLDNALKFRGPSTPEVSVSARPEGGAVIFSVADNGAGIPSRELESVFTLFARGEGAAQPGSGLGLAVAKKIVSLHGGRIWLESGPGKGTTARFTLPER